MHSAPDGPAGCTFNSMFRATHHSVNKVEVIPGPLLCNSLERGNLPTSHCTTSNRSWRSGAVAESEMCRRFATQVEARLAVFEFIEGWYNPHRRHFALDCESPISYEKKHRRPPDPKA